MREQLKLRFANSEEALPYLKETPNNELDQGIFKYPTLKVLCAYNGKAVGYLPTQQVMVLESLGLNPEADTLEQAQAIRDLVKGAELLASSYGIKEILFLGTDKRVIDMAKGHGFEEVPWPALRLRL